jgi:hypothetical protein
VGLVTGVLSLAREPARLTLRVWEFGFSTAAEAARLGLDLIDPGRETQGFAEYRAPSHPGAAGNGVDPMPTRAPAEPDVVVEEVPPAVPDELIPDHVDEEPVLVAEAAEEGAEDGAGPELHIEEPWDGYAKMTAADIRDRLSAATPAEAAAVELYESTHKSRRSVMDAAARALKGS